MPGRRVFGRGLAAGLVTTFRRMTQRAVTAQYPDVLPELPPRSRGVIALAEENCTVCMLCARECPDWCIYIESHKEEMPPGREGGRPRSRNVLDRFAIDFSLCMYCGICIEVCPFDALEWSPEFEYAELDIRDLVHERDRLGQWMATVPAPPGLDRGAAEPKELESARKAAEAPAGGRPAAAGGPAAAEPPVLSDGPDAPAGGPAAAEPPVLSDGPDAPAGGPAAEPPA